MHFVRRIVLLIWRSIQMVAWGIAAAGVFAGVLVVRAIREKRLNRSVLLQAYGRSLRFMLEGLGATFTKIEDWIEAQPLDSESKAALWMAAWSEQPRAQRRDMVTPGRYGTR